MDFVGGSADAVGELFEVGLNALCGIITGQERPAVINVDVLVTGILETQVYDFLRRNLYTWELMY